MREKSKKKVLIIGAGISGINFARSLPSDRFEVTLFDKGQGVGGRIATRRFEEGRWDHGIPWIESSVIPIEERPTWLSVLKPVEGLSFPKFRAPEGLTQLPKLLCSTLSVCKDCKIVRLEIAKETSSWVLEDDKQGRYSGDILVLTLPAPQAHDLLIKSRLLESTGWDSSLSQIVYRPQLVALGKSPSSFPSLWKPMETGPFELLLDNGKKGIGKSHGFFSAYLNASFSGEHFENSDETVIELVRQELKNRLGLEPEHLEIKRWRYSQTTRSLKENFLTATTPLPLFFIGDGLAGGQLAGAIASATKLAQHLKSF